MNLMSAAAKTVEIRNLQTSEAAFWGSILESKFSWPHPKSQNRSCEASTSSKSTQTFERGQACHLFSHPTLKIFKNPCEQPPSANFLDQGLGGILALRAHCVHTACYFQTMFPPKSPLGTPLGNTLRIRQPKLDWRGP